MTQTFIVVQGNFHCPYCLLAIQTLEEHKKQKIVLSLTKQQNINFKNAIEQLTGRAINSLTVPQIFIDDNAQENYKLDTLVAKMHDKSVKYIGGFSELQQYLNA